MASSDFHSSSSSPPYASSFSPPTPSKSTQRTTTATSASSSSSGTILASKEEPSFSQFIYTPPDLNSTISDSSFHYISSFTPRISTKLNYKCIFSVLKTGSQILSTAYSPDGLLYVGFESNMIRVWKFPEFIECDQLKTCKACKIIALVVSNDRVYAAYADHKIRVWCRTYDGAPVHVRLVTIPAIRAYIRCYVYRTEKMHMGPITSLAMNPLDDVVYSASLDKTVKVWRTSDFKCIETIYAHSEPINAIVVADDGALYTASDDATVRVWHRNFSSRDHNRPHSLTVTLPTKNSPVKTLTLTQTGAILYSGCTDGYIHYWNKNWFQSQLQYGGSLQGHTHAVMCLANVGKFVVSGSADSTCRVWERDHDGQHIYLAVLEGHRGPIKCVTTFLRLESCDGCGCTVCTGSVDGDLKIWQVSCKSNLGLCLKQKGPQNSEF